MFASADRRWRLGAALVALAVTAAACGSTETASTPTLATSTTEPAASESTSIDPVEPETAELAITEPESVDDTEPPPAEPAVNLFPDLDVLDIADGATVNLAAELGGGDKATLLWFFAPH